MDPISALWKGLLTCKWIVIEIARGDDQDILRVVIAGEFTDSAIEVFSSKKRIKLFSQNSNRLIVPKDSHDFKHIEGGFVYQNSDCICDNEVTNAKLKSNREATAQEKLDLEIAWKVAGLTKSNCVVYVKNGAMVAVGMGMTSRVDASICALRKAKELGIRC